MGRPPALLALLAALAASDTPHASPAPEAQAQPWLDAALPVGQRAAALLAKMTNEEKIAQLNRPSCGSPAPAPTPATLRPRPLCARRQACSPCSPRCVWVGADSDALLETGVGLLEYPAVLAGAHNATQVVANRNAMQRKFLAAGAPRSPHQTAATHRTPPHGHPTYYCR